MTAPCVMMMIIMMLAGTLGVIVVGRFVSVVMVSFMLVVTPTANRLNHFRRKAASSEQF